MKTNRVCGAARWAGPVLLIAAAASLANVYFKQIPKAPEVWDTARDKFYAKVSAHWLRPDVTTMTAQLRTGPRDTFDQLVLNTAFGRWRMKDVAPHAFSRVAEAYREGMWDSGFVDDLAPVFKELDARWLRERQQVLARGGIGVMPEVKPVENAGFSLIFPENTRTVDLGSLIEVAFTVSPGSAPQQRVNAYWITEQDPEPSNDRNRLCTVVDMRETSGGLPVQHVLMDMADCPEWIYTGTILKRIVFLADDGEVHWSPYAYRFKDSPLFKPEEAPRKE